MFVANTELQVAETNFKDIKENLKRFIAAKTPFADYDFEGSTLNYLLDVLAYNTYMNSFHTNMAINESFLDTAQIRSNVISNAKELGYTPKSALASSATITLIFTPSDAPPQIVIPRGTKFQSTKDGVNYNFVTVREHVVTPLNGVYAKDIQIFEGELLKQTFIYRDTQPFYEILESNVDLNSLIVTVKENEQSTDLSYYTRVHDIISLDSRSEVYYCQENSRERYELYFGDGILGKKLTNGNVINAEYISTRGELANGLTEFKLVGYAGYNINDANKKYMATLRLVERSSNGKSKESIESIRFNAPNFYSSQNRLVTAKDYENYVYATFPFVESVNVWGGEENDPPIYGRTILSVKPYDGYALQSLMKESMVNDMKKRSVIGIEPIIIDPIFTFIKPTINVTYDQGKTSKTTDELFNTIQTQIQRFESENLSIFGNSFVYSSFIKMIDNSDRSVIGNDTEIQLEKRIVPIYHSTISYKLMFYTSLRHPYEGYLGTLTSSGFKTNTTNETLYLEDDGFGNIRSIFYQSITGTKTIYKNNIGKIDYGTGTITLDAMYFTGLEGDDTEFQVFVIPESRNYTQAKNNILLLSHPFVQIRNNISLQIVKSGIVDVNGNYTPIPSSSINTQSIV